MKIFDESDLESFSSFFKGEAGHKRARIVMHLLAIDKVNRVYDNSGSYTGARFAGSLLEDLGVDYVVGNADRLAALPAGAFITISNHPYGGLDGIMLIDLMAGLRPDYKLMVNKMLSMVKTMKDNFISVTPTLDRKTRISRESIHGIRETITHIEEGHPAGFFPSGAVSDFSLKDLQIRDRAWQESVLHLIKSARVPVLPLRFFDANSSFFYFLGLINWKIRSLRQPAELFNKKRRKHRIGIGNLITVGEQDRFSDIRSFGAFLRNAVYEMPLPQTFITRTKIT